MKKLIAAISDTHSYLPEVSPADVLLDAGDINPDRFGPFTAANAPEQQMRWFAKERLGWSLTRLGLNGSSMPFGGTWGNHDYCGTKVDLHAYVDHVMHVDKLVTIGGLKVWFSPWSNQFGGWAFMKEGRHLKAHYDLIPVGTDVIVSHQPPYKCGDYIRYEKRNVGSFELRQAILRVRPKLVICGHIHGGYGIYDVDGIPIYNVSCVNERYELVRGATLIEIEVPDEEIAVP